MKLALFSDNITKLHIEKLKEIFGMNLHEAKFLYITTPTNYKPYKPDWCLEAQRSWMNIFPKCTEFDLERAYTFDPKFDFRKFLSDFDFIFVSGGSVYVLNYWAMKTGVNKILKELIESEKVVYGGESAGAIFVFKDYKPYSILDHPEIPPEAIHDGLNLIDVAPLPHWGVKDYQDSLEKIKKSLESRGYKVQPLTNDEALFVDGEIIEII